MLEVWTNLISIFVTYIKYFTDALYNVFDNLIGFDIKTFNINLLILSDTPIFNISLYHLINIILFSILFYWFLKTILSIIFAPLNAIKKYLSPRGVKK